jgi:Holliday junction resolvase
VRPKDIGTRAESAVVAYLQAQGFAAERRALAGVNDRGDVAGLPGIVVEVKDCARMELAAWVKEATREAVPICGSPALGVVWHKRRGRGSPGDWYVTMDGATFVALLKETGR